MSYSDYQRGADAAYYGFGCSHRENQDYVEGYRHTERIMEEEEMNRQMRIAYEKEMEAQYYAEMQEQFELETMWLEQNNYDYEQRSKNE